MAMAKIKDSKLGTRIFFGLVAGVIIGGVLNGFVAEDLRRSILHNVTGPIGNAFLRALFMVVVPLVFSSLITGIMGLGKGIELRRIGGRVLFYYMFTTLAAVLIGQALVMTIQPGEGLSPEFVGNIQQSLKDQTDSLKTRSSAVGESLWPGLVNTIIPKNILDELSKGNMLAVIFISVIAGMALLQLPPQRRQAIEDVLRGVSEASIVVIGWVMKLAPYAVAALIANAVATYDFQILKNVALFVITVTAGYLLHFFGTYTFILKVMLKLPVLDFYRRFSSVLVTAFSTSSSNATLPTNIKVLNERFGVPEKVTTFTMPLGATVNMDGTALFEVVTALFVAQVFQIDIGLFGHISLVLIVILTSIGVAGVPGGSIPILMSAMAFLNIPPEGIALVLGVDRLLDMGRTVVNVTGDALGALYVAQRDGFNVRQEFDKRG